MSRITPLTGTDVARQATADAGLLREGEIHTTLDQERVFFQNEIIAPRLHDDVGDEDAMLALDETSAFGCFRGDKVIRTDTGSLWECISGRGLLLTDWKELSITGGGTSGGTLDGGDAAGLADDVDGGDAGDEFDDIVDGSDDPGI